MQNNIVRWQELIFIWFHGILNEILFHSDQTNQSVEVIFSATFKTLVYTLSAKMGRAKNFYAFTSENRLKTLGNKW